MHLLQGTALAAISAGLAIANPIEARDGQFSVQQVSVGTKPRTHPAVSMFKTYGKFARMGAQAPARVSAAAAAAASQTGTVTATPEEYDEEYLCPVKVGDDTLNLDFDTGSADLWVYSTLQSSSEQSGHAVYNPSTGTLLKGYSWDIDYGDGSSAEGVVYADKVVVGAVTATSQAVEAATSVSSEFLEDVDDDGLLGLAFSTINTVEPQAQTTFFDTVKSSLALAVFTADLKAGEAGSYDFGVIDSSKYTGSITYVDVDSSEGYWAFTAGGYAVGTGSVSGSIGSVIADTGTTLIYLPDSVVNAYYKEVSGATDSEEEGGYIFSCETTLPDLKIEIGGATYTVPGTYLNYAPVTSSQCFGGIQSSDGLGLNILGDIFLKSVFVVFDKTNANTPTIGFASKTLST